MNTQQKHTEVGLGQSQPVVAMLEAHYALQEGRHDEAHLAMTKALQLCKRIGCNHLKLLNTQFLKDLLIWSYQQGIEKEYVKQSLNTLMMDGPDVIDINTKVDKPVKISTLGDFTVQVGDQTLSYTRAGYSKPFELLKALISFGGRQVNRTKIIDTLWPDAEGDSARRNFDTTLHRLRKMLNHSKALVLHGSQLTLDPHYVWVDIWEFDRTIGQIDGELHRMSSNPDLVQQLTHHVLKLYQGHFLHNDHVRPWTLSLREGLNARFSHMLMRLAKYWQKQDNNDLFIELLLRGVELDNTSEILYQELMKGYIKQGRMSDAAATYLRCRQALSTNLNVLPSSETVRIYKSTNLQNGN